MGTISSATAASLRRAVHPHGRGDNFQTSDRRGAPNGSPPRAWGQSLPSTFAQSAVRFTPTGVGTIALNWSSVNPYPVHPHGRGDNMTAILEAATSIGSPPRAWGQSLTARAGSISRRFTPTGVGTMLDNPDLCCYSRFTPTGVGTIGDNAARVRVYAGSPPRAWGQLATAWVNDVLPRFTPTGVGTIRGTARTRDSARFTPTGVGTMRFTNASTGVLPVHPHGRGDNLRGRASPLTTNGSPPRAWGQSQQRPLLRPR